MLKAAFYAMGCLFFGYRILDVIASGSSTTLGRTSRILGERYSMAAEPSQFWWVQVIFLVFAVTCGYLAWREYRN